MADVVSIALSVAATLTVQGVYFVLLKYPQQLSQEKLALETCGLEMNESTVDQNDALSLLEGGMGEMGELSDGLHIGTTPEKAADLLQRLEVRAAQMQGLEITEQPLASHLEKLTAAISRGAEMAKDWQGAPSVQGAAELDLRVKTMLYSAQAVKRSHDRKMNAFWMQMRERQIALRSLVQTFLASAIGLEVLSILFLGLGCQLLTAHGLLPVWAAWTVWVITGLGVHIVIRRVWRVVLPINALVRSIEQTSAEELKRHAPVRAQGEAPKQETQSA